MPLGIYVAVLVLSGGLTLALTPLAIRLGERQGWVDVPGGRRRHVGSVTRIGGVPLFPAFAAAAALSLLVSTNDALEATRLQGVLLGLAIVWIMGFVDDLVELPAWAQFVGLVAASGVAIGHKVFIELFNNPFTDQQIQVGWYLMVPLTILWLTGMTSTVNLVDGLNGLAAGVTAISALVLFAHMLRLGQYSVAVLPLALLGVCLGFLPFNFGRARIFLGGGAHLLGFALATLSIVAGAKVASALLVVWLPLVDAVWQAYRRWRRGGPIGHADRGHLHFILQDMGYPTHRIVLLYYGMTLALGGVALLVSSRLLKLAILSGVAVIILVALALLARRANREEAARPQTGE